MIINKISPVNFNKPYVCTTHSLVTRPDSLVVENPYINKKPFIDRKIIPAQKNINRFFDETSSQIFNNKTKAQEFSNLLKYGFISLSSSCYSNLAEPYSAVGSSVSDNLVKRIEKGQGVGINFSKLDNPTLEIKKINSQFKALEPNYIRPPAGIALLDINHPKIKEFITLKDNEDYRDWCFDLSVVMDDKFNDKETYSLLLNSMLKKGEPGVIFSNDKDYICDSCAAAKLKEGEGLTLGHINLSRFYNHNKKMIDYGLLKRSTDLLKEAMDNIDPNSYIGVLGYQELLDNLNLEYGSDAALGVLENCLKTIKSSNAKTAISPTGTISRVLNTTAGIDPKEADYKKELKTMALAQKFLDGQISKTLILNNNATIDDVDYILTYARKNGIKGISVFKK